jgi:hypothetical protein
MTRPALPLHHDPRHAVADEHDCEPRFEARCASCGQAYALCHVGLGELQNLVSQAWHCWPCLVTSRPVLWWLR